VDPSPCTDQCQVVVGPAVDGRDTALLVGEYGAWLSVTERGRPVVTLRLVDGPTCPFEYDCGAVRWVGAEVELREQTRITPALAGVRAWRIAPWPVRVLARTEDRPEFGGAGLVLSLDHATLAGTFTTTHGTVGATGRPLPIVSVAAPFGTPLGACAVTDDAATAAAVVHGTPGEPGDARLSAVLVSDRELWVEVSDDAIRSGAPTWLFDDHVELWAAQPGGRAAQWAVGLDGTVIDATGTAPMLPTAKAQRTPGGARLQIALPAPATALTVVYSDSDDGRTQERLVATSRFTRGDPATFSPVRHAEGATECVIGADGRLEPRLRTVTAEEWTALRATLR
jgi:hypothetical protein